VRVSFIYNKIEHHAGLSGYDQIHRFAEERIEADNIPGDIPRLMPMKAMEWLAKRASMEWYGPWSLALEAAGARRLLSARGGICHLLYGENDYRFLGAVAPLARRRGGRIVCSYHQPPAIFEQVGPPRNVLGRLDAIVAVASNQAEYFASVVGEERVFLVRHGVDTETFRPGENGSGDGFECLLVGRWLRDLDLFANVVRRVRAAEPAIRFTAVTDPGNVAWLGELDGVEACSGISDDELLAAYRRASLLVLPLTDCTANNALLEGLGCGLPIVTTDVGGVRDYVGPDCATITPRGDTEAMVAAILELAGDDARRRAMGVRSRERALSVDWRRTVDDLIGVYETVLERP
jgi:glycosyltransferase involved in cell wall biosynthesis